MPDLKLRECPFCGEMPFTRVYVTKWSGCSAEIQCSVKCRCGINKTVSLELCDTDFNKVIQAMELVTIDWSRRAGENHKRGVQE